MMLSHLACASVVAASVLIGAPAPARAEPPGVDLNLVSDKDWCGHRVVNVTRWTPALGPVAPFVAKNALRGGEGTLIGLGVTDEGFWSTQVTVPDGCGDPCATIDLVLTRFADGRSTRHPLWSSADASAVQAHPEDADALRERTVTRRLWAYAGTVWSAASMRQDYALATPKAKDGEPGWPQPYPGWIAAVVREGRWQLRFTTQHSQTACFCFARWTAVARPGP